MKQRVFGLLLSLRRPSVAQKVGKETENTEFKALGGIYCQWKVWELFTNIYVNSYLCINKTASQTETLQVFVLFLWTGSSITPFPIPGKLLQQSVVLPSRDVRCKMWCAKGKSWSINISSSSSSSSRRICFLLLDFLLRAVSSHLPPTDSSLWTNLGDLHRLVLQSSLFTTKCGDFSLTVCFLTHRWRDKAND